MSDIYEFNLPTASCESCIASILTQLEISGTETGIIVKSHQFDREKKVLKLQIENNRKKRETNAEILRHYITKTGFPCREITQKTTSAPAPLYKRVLTSNWFLAALGTISGATLLLFSVFFTGGLSLVGMAAIGAGSTALTLALGAPFYYQAVINLVKARTLTMDTLFTVSTLTVIITSLASFVVPWLPMMFEAGLLIFGFRYLGLAIEETITQNIGVEKLFKDRLPFKVKVIDEEERELSTIKENEILQLYAKDTVPVDGECLTTSLIYDTIITGSPLPRVVKPGEKLLAGMVLAEDASPMKLKATPIIVSLESGDRTPVDGVSEQDCEIFDEDLQEKQQISAGDFVLAGTRLESATKIKVTSVATYSYLHRLDKNNEQAQFEKAPIQETTARSLQYFIPTVILVAIISGIIIGLFFPPALALQCAISVLVAACPCTLGLITPLAVKIGMNKAADHGVQFKSAKMLEAADSVTAVVFDVHGTLTTGIPQVTHFGHDPHLCSKETMFGYFAAMEKNAGHPIAKAIIEYVKNVTPEGFTVSEIDKNNHSGVRAKIIRQLPNNSGTTDEIEEELILGNQTMMEENNIDVSSLQNLNLKGGQSLVYLARNKQLLGYMLLTDPLRPNAKETIAALTKMGKKIFLCTGADKMTAESIAELLDIPLENIAWGCVGYSENSQEKSKTAFIKKLQAEGHVVAMIGDAANDSSAVASCFGIAIRSKSADEITHQKASVVIQGDSLQPIVNVFTIAKQTVANIKQNLGFSLIYNMASMTLTGGLLVALGFTLNPAVGVVLMILQTSLILLNAYRFKTQNPGHVMPKKVEENDGPRESYGCLANFFNSKKPEITLKSELQEEVAPTLLFGNKLLNPYSPEPDLFQHHTVNALQ
ncbi:heavy metal translocating P-type ATPase [Legionella hackeliae]|uniref:Copper-exporting ATPase n=1 Tax=Legionella hackeliae TaxID=449 RepID=A0A0A8URN7_LEGHA|nr:HAD-IC family P-type ATPase [Legionella hackeliae]KTD10256.1 cation transporting ATPase PacS [Legionella hackeliae]CEK09752.1 Copper-exporting ATPase [Legionella hackeliae]STX49662.1 cation transporting ATPase PacS [Legionella hackeliae]